MAVEALTSASPLASLMPCGSPRLPSGFAGMPCGLPGSVPSHSLGSRCSPPSSSLCSSHHSSHSTQNQRAHVRPSSARNSPLSNRRACVGSDATLSISNVRYLPRTNLAHEDSPRAPLLLRGGIHSCTPLAALKCSTGETLLSGRSLSATHSGSAACRAFFLSSSHARMFSRHILAALANQDNSVVTSDDMDQSGSGVALALKSRDGTNSPSSSSSSSCSSSSTSIPSNEDEERELSWGDLVSPEVAEEVTQRLQRLEVLMLVRRLYRDVGRSERVIRIPVPTIARDKEGTQLVKEGKRGRRGTGDWLKRALGGGNFLGGRFEIDDADVAPEPLELNSASEVLEFAADIRELADSLKVDSLRLQDRLPIVFPAGTDVVGRVKGTVETLEGQLLGLSERIEQSLTADERKAAEEERELQRQDENVQARVLRRLEGLSSTGQEVLGQVVGQRIAGVGQGLSQFNLATTFTNFSPLMPLQGAKNAGSSALQTLGDLWRRLNGLPDACDLEPLAAGLPRPESTLGEQEEKKVALLLQVEALDKKLTEASRAREGRLRQKNSLARTRLLATEIRALDDEVNEVRKQLAVRALQLEMQLIYMALESELLLSPSSRDIWTDEDEALIIAEFGLLDTDLAPLRTAVDRQDAVLIDDGELDVLAVDIPDLKQRLGIVEAPTVPLNQRVQLTVEETQAKLSEGSSFLWRGLRLLAGDISYSFRLFWFVANGATLKAREVQTLRRTAKDILVIVPFTIILIAPITPVGHVVVFSFLQKYFPGFFPSSFSARRQEVMKRYEVLKMELESGSNLASMDREQAAAMAAAAAAETFEAREDEENTNEHGAPSSNQVAAPPQWLMPVFGGGMGRIGGRGTFSTASRVLADDPKKLRLLQEKLPGISGLLADLKTRENSRQQQLQPLLPQSTEGASTD